jgi:hypothetical protein
VSEKPFPPGSRWRSRGVFRCSVIVYGEAGGVVTYRWARGNAVHTRTVDEFLKHFDPIPHPEEPRP